MYCRCRRLLHAATAPIYSNRVRLSKKQLMAVNNQMKNAINDEILAQETKCIAKAQKIPYTPVAFQKGEGALLYDYAGKTYIDFLSSASSANIGHGNREIAEAVKKQMETIAQYCMVYFPMKEPVELAQVLIEMAGREDMMVCYSTTGSESIDAAIKYARAFTGRSKIISFFEAYHGSTYGAISVSALSNNMRRKIGPLLPEVYHFQYPCCARCKYGKQKNTCELECLGELQYAFKHYIPCEEIAAVFIEPIAGDAGLIVPPSRYVQALAQLCKENGILLVSDEIQQGVGRTGKWFALDHFEVDADLYVLGKSIGAGLPLGVLMGRREIMQALDAPAHLFSHSGNSTVCVACMKMLEIYKRENINAQSAQKGEYLKQKLEALMQKHAVIGDVRGIGLSIGVDLVKDRTTMEKNYTAAAKISYKCMEDGLLLTFVGQSTLRVQPPLVITYAQMDEALNILEHALQEYEAGTISNSILEQVKGW